MKTSHCNKSLHTAVVSLSWSIAVVTADGPNTAMLLNAKARMQPKCAQEPRRQNKVGIWRIRFLLTFRFRLQNSNGQRSWKLMRKTLGAGERSDHTRSISPWACFCHVCSIWKPGTDYPTPLQTTYRVKLRHFSPSRKEEKWRRNGGLRTVYGIKSSPLMCTMQQKGWKS